MRKMDVKPGETAIDLCCGTCDWTIALARSQQDRQDGRLGLQSEYAGFWTAED